jgi:hypothetical protein
MLDHSVAKKLCRSSIVRPAVPNVAVLSPRPRHSSVRLSIATGSKSVVNWPLRYGDPGSPTPESRSSRARIPGEPNGSATTSQSAPLTSLDGEPNLNGESLNGENLFHGDTSFAGLCFGVGVEGAGRWDGTIRGGLDGGGGEEGGRPEGMAQETPRHLLRHPFRDEESEGGRPWRLPVCTYVAWSATPG